MFWRNGLGSGFVSIMFLPASHHIIVSITSLSVSHHCQNYVIASIMSLSSLPASHHCQHHIIDIITQWSASCPCQHHVIVSIPLLSASHHCQYYMIASMTLSPSQNCHHHVIASIISMSASHHWQHYMIASITSLFSCEIPKCLIHKILKNNEWLSKHMNFKSQLSNIAFTCLFSIHLPLTDMCDYQPIYIYIYIYIIIYRHIESCQTMTSYYEWVCKPLST